MAHELTHVKNRDVLIMTMASFFASARVDDRSSSRSSSAAATTTTAPRLRS